MIVRVEGNARYVCEKVFRNNNYGVPKHSQKLSDGSYFIVYENFTFRNGNYMTLSVLIENKEDHCLIHFVPGGTSRGLFGFDWGAASSREKRFIRILSECGLDFKVLKE